MVNEAGGIAGRKISYIIYDDGFAPPKTLEMTRRLIEGDQVAFLLSQLGTGPNSAIVKYVNSSACRTCSCRSTATSGAITRPIPGRCRFAPSARTECQIFVKYALQQKPDAKFAILYQNDDLGRDFVAGAKDVLGAKYDSLVKAPRTRSPTRRPTRS